MRAARHALQAACQPQPTHEGCTAFHLLPSSEARGSRAGFPSTEKLAATLAQRCITLAAAEVYTAALLCPGLPRVQIASLHHDQPQPQFGAAPAGAPAGAASAVLHGCGSFPASRPVTLQASPAVAGAAGEGGGEGGRGRTTVLCAVPSASAAREHQQAPAGSSMGSIGSRSCDPCEGHPATQLEAHVAGSTHGQHGAGGCHTSCVASMAQGEGATRGSQGHAAAVNSAEEAGEGGSRSKCAAEQCRLQLEQWTDSIACMEADVLEALRWLHAQQPAS